MMIKIFSLSLARSLSLSLRSDNDDTNIQSLSLARSRALSLYRSQVPFATRMQLLDSLKSCRITYKGYAHIGRLAILHNVLLLVHFEREGCCYFREGNGFTKNRDPRIRVYDPGIRV